MELCDEKLENQKTKIPMIIGILIAILVLMTVLVVVAIIYLKSSITIISVDGVRNNEIEKILYVETAEDGTENLYVPILQIAEYLKYEGFSGDYKYKSEDKNKCHVKDLEGNETAMFTKDSDILVKIAKDSAIEYVKIDKPAFEKDGQLYTTIDGIQKAFNVLFETDKNYKKINMFSMDYLVQAYATRLKIKEYSTDFSDKKAIFENMLIIKENTEYGVIKITGASSKKYVLETKYEEVRYLPETTDFIVKTNGKKGIMTKDAEIKVNINYDEIKVIDNQNGLYLVKQNNSYGVINKEGQPIINPDYKQIGIDISKYAQNGVENKYILLNEVIPVKNQDDLWGFYNINGEKITDFKYQDIGCVTSPVNNAYSTLVIPSYKIIVVKNDKYYNLVTVKGEELIPGNIVDSVYSKIDPTTGQNKYFMTSNGYTKVLNIEEWLESTIK